MRTYRNAIIAGCMMLLPAWSFADGHPGAGGKIIASTCYGCHGPNGVSKGAIPSLKGLGADHIKTQMMAFRSGSRSGTIMNRIAKGYSDAEIAAVAAYIGMQ